MRLASAQTGGHYAEDVEGRRSAAPAVPNRWLRSSTSSSATEVSRRLIAQASQEFDVGAWLSAETSAWEAMRWAAKSIDLLEQERGVGISAATFTEGLSSAYQTIREARDFGGVPGDIQSDIVGRIARGHQTKLLDHQVAQLSPADAADRYLDAARVKLAPIAGKSVEAAQAMDLLASIYLRRAQASTLPSATALCLRRAALQGQPHNSSLAARLGMHLSDVGLLEEARWALEHSMSLEPSESTANALAQVMRQMGHTDEAASLLAQSRGRLGVTQSPPPAIRVPEITHLSPTEFAALSRPVVWATKPNTRTATPPQVESTQPAAAQSASKRGDALSSLTSGSNIGDTRTTLASSRSNTHASPVSGQSALAETDSIGDEAGIGFDNKPGVMRRVLGSLKRFW